MRDKSRIHLTQSRYEERPRVFSTGELVAESGLYSVLHHPHPLPLEVTLLAGQLFPRCSKCSEARFQLARATPELDLGKEFRIHLYELPEVESEESYAA